ncbi:holin family protein [Clostridium felsineum]|uniref:phage holin family protein n=1 Tax=Clostridium felsineum TaxID=36839 RepID=UPI00214D513F|nr:holin family protein [Clostridium felsineum]MCR3761264.1 holin family protein [Clostridium felsineum]
MLGVIFTCMQGMSSYMFGSWDTPIMVLIFFMIIDYLGDIVISAVEKKLNFRQCYMGIAKILSILVVIIVAVLLDRLVNKGTWLFRTFTCYFYVANEGINILENCSKLGLPMPEKLMRTLEDLKNK